MSVNIKIIKIKINKNIIEINIVNKKISTTDKVKSLFVLPLLFHLHSSLWFVMSRSFFTYLLAIMLVMKSEISSNISNLMAFIVTVCVKEFLGIKTT